MNKAQVSTDTPIILSILVFQAFIIIMLGFLNTSDISVNNPNNNIGNYNETSQSSTGETITTTNTGNSLFSFGNIITNISLLGWFNGILFAPLEVCLIYIIAKLIRGGG